MQDLLIFHAQASALYDYMQLDSRGKLVWDYSLLVCSQKFFDSHADNYRKIVLFRHTLASLTLSPTQTLRD